MDKQYSIQFFTKFVEAMQKFCRDYLDFEQAVELSGYLSLEIDNYKKERYILSEMVHNTGDVISESYCVKAFKTMKRLPPRNSNSDVVLRDNTNTRRPGHGGSREATVDLRGSPDRQPISYNTRIPSSGYPITSPASSRHNVHSGRRPHPSFAAGGPGQVEGQSRPLNVAMQIQPRQSTFSSQGMSSDDAMIVSVQTVNDTGSSSMSSPAGRSSDLTSNMRGQKRNIPQSEESPSHKKDKLDTDLESLYSAATSIVPTSETEVIKDIYSTMPVPSTSQNDSNTIPNISDSTQSTNTSEQAESVRLPIPDTVTIKEENDVVFLDSPHDDSNIDFDSSQMEGSYVMDEGSQGASGGTGEDQEENAHTARKTKAHVKLFQNAKLEELNVGLRSHQSTLAGSYGATQQSSKPVPSLAVASLAVASTQNEISSIPSKNDGRSMSRKVHRCDQCDYTTFYTTNLARHKRKHSGDFFQCPMCPKQSSDQYEHVYHLKGHTGQLCCEVCGKTYGSHQGLSLHRRTYKH